MSNDVRRVYYRKNGRLNRTMVGGFSDDVASDMERYTLKELRVACKADKNSPVMAIVK